MTRFAFGRNWRRYLRVIDDRRIGEAERDLRRMLEMDRLDGLSFLDIGCGSGLSSLAARRLGARVHSFDYDVDSVACALELRGRYYPEDPDWTVERGSVLDDAYLRALGTFDIVYAWGVLHHTGAMWQALDNALIPVSRDNLFFVTIYNDQGRRSRRWCEIKRVYNELPSVLRPPAAVLLIALLEAREAVHDLLSLQPGAYLAGWRNYHQSRGMSRLHDSLDWIGGYPFEVARPEEIFEFCRQRGLMLRKLKTTPGSGCNEFVFKRLVQPAQADQSEQAAVTEAA